MSTEAERKARQRAGYTNIYVEVRLPELLAALLAAGLITEAQLEDERAIREAASRAFQDWYKGGARILIDQTAKEPPPRQTYKPLPQPKPRHGPVRGWTASDTERWEDGWRGDEPSPPEGEWEQIRKGRWCKSFPWPHIQGAKRRKKRSPQRTPDTGGRPIVRFIPPGKKDRE